MVKGVEGKTSDETLWTLHLFRVQKRSVRGDFIAVYNFLMKGSRKGSVDLVVVGREEMA